MEKIAQESIDLLQQMIAIPSVSRSEGEVADMLEGWIREHVGIAPVRVGNNLVVKGETFDDAKPILLLNGHIDTVRAASGYTRNPHDPQIEDGVLYGLGSNDAGASVVSLIAAFRILDTEELPVNLLLAISAEEEVSGEGGMRMLLPELRQLGLYPAMGIVGEPTGMHPAVAERGLMVLDGQTQGVSGHAARNEGVNALYLALDDIDRLRRFEFERESQMLGPIKVTVTQIEAGRQHNVVPDMCKWVVDVRTTDAYSNEETAAILQQAVSEATTLTPRSTRIRASVIDESHPLVRSAVAAGRQCYVSPTTSDMALMWDFPTLKLGPGESARSHTANEYVKLSEIEEGISLYCQIIRDIKL